MNRPNGNLLAAVRFAIGAGVLTLVCAYGAYAQGAGAGDKAIAKMLIAGFPGDNPDGTIEVVGIDQRLTNPPPAAGANPAPALSLMITKKIDRATPRLFVVGISGEVVRHVKITWTKINSTTNQEEFSHSITMTDVLVTSVRQRPANVADPEARQSDEYEDVTFSFASIGGMPAGMIEWEYALPGGRTLVRTRWDFRTNRQG